MLAAYFAGKLRNAWLATSVSLVTLHHPLQTVETFNLLDVLTKGKVLFGLAGGGGADTLEAAGAGVLGRAGAPSRCTAKTALQTAQRALTPASGTLAGSTR